MQGYCRGVQHTVASVIRSSFNLVRQADGAFGTGLDTATRA